jgi:hypothetical protein
MLEAEGGLAMAYELGIKVGKLEGWQKNRG